MEAGEQLLSAQTVGVDIAPRNGVESVLVELHLTDRMGSLEREQEDLLLAIQDDDVPRLAIHRDVRLIWTDRHLLYVFGETTRHQRGGQFRSHPFVYVVELQVTLLA